MWLKDSSEWSFKMAKRLVVDACGTEKLYDGDFDASVSPNGELLIVENVPDVGNTNGGQATKKLVTIYSRDSWNNVEIG